MSDLEGFEKCYKINGKRVDWSNLSCTGWNCNKAEWEYAARGGESYIYAGSNSVDDVAWYRTIRHMMFVARTQMGMVCVT